MWGEATHRGAGLRHHNALTYPYGVLKFFVLCSRAAEVGSRPTSKRRNPLLRGRPVAAAFRKQKHRGTNRHVFCGPTAIPTG